MGESITAEQLEVIRDGSFRDLYVGDYWEINGTKYRIADINYWRNVGYPESEKVQKPHILIVPDTTLGSGQMNANNSTAGGYRNSAIGVYWLRNVASERMYTLVSQYGDASSDMATSTYGIRPVFAIG